MYRQCISKSSIINSYTTFFVIYFNPFYKHLNLNPPMGVFENSSATNGTPLAIPWQHEVLCHGQTHRPGAIFWLGNE